MVIPIRSQALQVNIGSCPYWQGAGNPTNMQVMASIAESLVSTFNKELPCNIVISYNQEKGPMTIFERERPPEQPIKVLLSVEELSLWDKLIYQLSHELCHVLTNYEISWTHGIKRNMWLEEALCETASIFVLYRLQEEWLSSSHRGLQEYAKRQCLRKYADNEVKKYQCADLPTYFAEYRSSIEQDAVEKDGEARICNRISGKLTPYFLKNPVLWQECKYLNTWEEFKDEPIEDYLIKWRGCVATQPSTSELPDIIGNLLGLKTRIKPV